MGGFLVITKLSSSVGVGVVVEARGLDCDIRFAQ